MRKRYEKDGKRKHLRPTRELELFPSDVEAKGDKESETAKSKICKGLHLLFI